MTKQKKKIKTIAIFEYMIRNKLYKYCTDSWTNDRFYSSVSNLDGQHNYRGETFVINQCSGTNGLGGMSDGTPDFVVIIRIKRG